MKRVIKSATFGGYRYQYEAHWISPRGKDILLGANSNLLKAEQIALDHMKEMMTNPFESVENKIHFIENCYIYDADNDEVIDSTVIEDTKDTLLYQLEKQL